MLKLPIRQVCRSSLRRLADIARKHPLGCALGNAVTIVGKKVTSSVTAIRGNCLHISEKALDCEDEDHDRCECKCGQHRHFMNAGDREAAMLVIVPPKAKT